MEHRDIDYQYIPELTIIDIKVVNHCLFNKNLRFIFIFVGIKNAVFLFTLIPRHSTLEQQQHQHSYWQVSVDG